MNVSAVLITLNEEKNIEEAIRSVSWADEVVVVDAFSSDATAEICRRCGARLIQREWKGYVEQKNFAAAQARERWVFSLDADERVSPSLQEEIRALSGSGVNGYRIPRRTFFLNQWIEHTSWSPDYQVRLFDRTRGRWRGGRLHESVEVDGSVGRLHNPLLHYSYRSVGEFLQRLDRYSRLAAEDCYEQGRRARAHHLLAEPVAAFIKSYFIKRGFQDGLAGLAVSALAGISVFFRYLKLLEMEREAAPRGGGPSACAGR
ncbi:MAG: glycosyltransferase family 2 protein [Acidobacteria bacterium]|nr:glycosyltransferase family 2 protein [Acidobacteriota bacterium]